jgi:hypothetical protein
MRKREISVAEKSAEKRDANSLPAVPIVEIEWVDSCGLVSVWEDAEALRPLVPSLHYTVGYLMESTPKYITVAQSWHPDSIGRRFSIPRGCVRKMRTVRR